MKNRLLTSGIAVLLISIFIISSCSKKSEVENTTTVKMAGEWFVEYFEDADPVTPVTGHSILLTYNTSDAASGQIWVDDHNVWPFKAKMNVDYGSLSFGAMDNTPNTAIAGKSVKVFEGKVLPKAGHSKTGNIVDSIYLKLEFSDDPGNIYQVRGHFRTGFFEDEY